ncbi:SDR family oxidoreductase [Streptacidiphilus sp. PAMC 29251]
MRIAVAGGTGVVGAFVVEAVHAAGHTPVVLARSVGVDVVSGQGLDQALRGASVVVDVSNVTSTSAAKSIRFFEAATGNLLAAGQRAGVSHHVALSIVGVDRVDLGYYLGKRRQEALVLAEDVPGGVPGSVLRATQFHEFAAQMLERGGPLAVAPRMLSQPVAAREVAEALVELAVGEPVGLAPELAGPRQEQMTDMVRRLLRARGSRRPLLPLRLPGAAGKAVASGGLLPTGAGPRGSQTFDQWLADNAGSSGSVGDGAGRESRAGLGQ